MADTAHEKMIEKAKEMVALEREIARLEDELKAAKTRHEVVSTQEMPEIMDEADVAEFVTPGGKKFSIKEQVFVALKAADRPKMFAWCRENGLAGVVKTSVEVAMGQGGEANDNADALVELANEAGMLHGLSAYNCALGYDLSRPYDEEEYL